MIEGDNHILFIPEGCMVNCKMSLNTVRLANGIQMRPLEARLGLIYHSKAILSVFLQNKQ